jgi:hypothetical protein
VPLVWINNTGWVNYDSANQMWTTDSTGGVPTTYLWSNGTATSTSTATIPCFVQQGTGSTLYIYPQHNQLWTVPVQPRIHRPHVRPAALQRDLQRTDAELKARELLLRSLTPEQRASIERHKWFLVEGRSGRLYRIRDQGHAVANIDVVERDLLGQDRVLHRLCGHLDDGGIPIADHMLAQKLMLEADEDAFLRLANRHG